MDTQTVGLISPGEMGAAVGACLVQSGHRVLWASEGRGATTAARAGAAGLVDAGATAGLAAECEVIFSICPPAAAGDVAATMQGFGGIFVDANAVSPMTAGAIGQRVAAAGATFVDGGIIGSPPTESGTTRLYLSGERAEEIADMFRGSVLESRVVSTDPGDASALKMVYAAWTKGTSAMILAIRELAAELGVEAELLAEWEISQPALQQRWGSASRSAESKGWRWVAEMEEIASTFEAHDLPGGFHRAAADVFRRIPSGRL